MVRAKTDTDRPIFPLLALGIRLSLSRIQVPCMKARTNKIVVNLQKEEA